MFGRTLDERIPLLEEGIEVLRKAWTGEEFEYRGRRVRVTPRPGPPRGAGPAPRGCLAGGRPARRPPRPRVPARRRHGVGLLPGGVPRARPGGRPRARARRSPGSSTSPTTPTRRGPASRPTPSTTRTSTAPGWPSANERGPYEMTDDVDSLRTSGAYVVLTPDECVARVRETGSLMLHPLMGGLDPDLAWESLELIAVEGHPPPGRARLRAHSAVPCPCPPQLPGTARSTAREACWPTMSGRTDRIATSWPAAWARSAPTVQFSRPPERRERVVAEVLHGVEVGDAVDVVVADVAVEVLGDLLGRERPRRVGVRVVALPHHVVHVEGVAVGDAEAVVDEAGEHALVEHLARAAGRRSPARSRSGAGGTGSRCARGSTGSSRCRPRTGRSCRSGNLREHRRPDEVGGGLHDVDRRERDQAVDRRVRRGDHQLRRRPDVHAHDDAPRRCTPARTGPSGRSGCSASRASTGSRRT